MISHHDKGKRPIPATRKSTKIVEAAVSGKLKAYYDDISSQDVPDRFLDLLKQLDESATQDNV
ncbi:NepR family anti-sigma factor [Aestuariivirga sp.]|uniref:NepR family anti-sigma factor n=1 Tax=Aestuariivirga sp. TaxID=2650926 RepID=UPI0039E44646